MRLETCPVDVLQKHFVIPVKFKAIFSGHIIPVLTQALGAIIFGSTNWNKLLLFFLLRIILFSFNFPADLRENKTKEQKPNMYQ